jgi:hypothetical protein
MPIRLSRFTGLLLFIVLLPIALPVILWKRITGRSRAPSYRNTIEVDPLSYDGPRPLVIAIWASYATVWEVATEKAIEQLRLEFDGNCEFVYIDGSRPGSIDPRFNVDVQPDPATKPNPSSPAAQHRPLLLQLILHPSAFILLPLWRALTHATRSGSHVSGAATMRHLLTLVLTIPFLFISRSLRAEGGDWPATPGDWTAPAPGEHPRLFFRKSDLPDLKRRMATPEGQAILKRLRFLLNGADGESMPKHRRPLDAAFGDKSREIALPEGAYTIGHAAGFGLLYQLTGEKKYADLGRQCFEWAFEGTRDIDAKGRYSWKLPSGALRAGPSLAWYAVAYDLCYDGWDEPFRLKVAQELATYGHDNPDRNCRIENMAAGKRQHPGSNHWGPQIAGPALALLAVTNDPGVDQKRVAELLKLSEAAFLKQLATGWGDHGFFDEGDGPGTISSDTAFLPALQAWRIAAGKDFVTPRPHAQWMTLKWVMLTLPEKVSEGKKPYFPIRGVYGHNVYSRTGMSGSGTFAQGFGTLEDEYKPALLWLYNRTFRDADQAAGKPLDTVSVYPHRAVMAFLNWPLGVSEKNPAQVLPRAVEDKAQSFYMFRNRWQDKDDIIVTALLKGQKGNYSVPGGEIIIAGLGKRTKFPVKVTGDTKHFAASPHGGVVSTSAGSFGVDFSAACGADALLVLSGPVSGAVKGDGVQLVKAGNNTFTVMVLSRGQIPEIKPQGDALQIGGQTVRVVDGNLAFDSWHK